jgi:tryptophan 2,3-dioxygenase
VVGARDAHDAAARAVLTAALERRGLDDEFLHLLARRGHPVPADVPARDAREPHREDPRTIGFRTGTGGTTGASFLRRVLDLTFFPELYAVRTALGGGA